MGVNQVATVKELTSGRYQVTVTGTELALISSALDEAERVSRFGIEVLDEADRGRDGEPAEGSRLLREIDALAMREASLRSLQKTMAEADLPAMSFQHQPSSGMASTSTHVNGERT
jgi:hypothetical protein